MSDTVNLETRKILRSSSSRSLPLTITDKERSSNRVVHSDYYGTTKSTALFNTLAEHENKHLMTTSAFDSRKSLDTISLDISDTSKSSVISTDSPELGLQLGSDLTPTITEYTARVGPLTIRKSHVSSRELISPKDSLTTLIQSTCSQESPTDSLETNSPRDSLNSPSKSAVQDRQKLYRLKKQILYEKEALEQLETLAQVLPRSNSRKLEIKQREHKQEQTPSTPTTLQPPNINLRSDSLPHKALVRSLYREIDTLKLQAQEYCETLQEERRINNTLKRKLELVEDSMKLINEQNQRVNKQLEKKEQKITCLELEIRRQDSVIKQFELSEARRDADQRVNTIELQRHRDEKLHLEANYNALIQSTKTLKDKHAADMKSIINSLNRLQQERDRDQEQINAINKRLKSQLEEREQLLHLHAETTYMRQKHLEQIDKIFGDMRNVVSNSEKSMERKMNFILDSIAEFHAYEAQLKASLREL